MQAAPNSERLLADAAKRGSNLGAIVSALLRLLSEYGAAELEAGIDEALKRGVPHPNAVRQSLTRRREQQNKPPPVPVDLPKDPRVGYRRDPDDDARWRRLGSVVSINGFMFYDHLSGEWGAGAIELVIHARRCTVPEALTFLWELPGPSRLPTDCLCAPAPRTPPRPLKPSRSERQWPAVHRYLVDERGLSPVLLALCRELGLLYADRHGNAVFVCRNAAGEETGAEIVPTAGQRSGSILDTEAATSPLTPGSFWMSWDPDWPLSVLLAKSAPRRPVSPLPPSHAGQAQGMCRGLNRRRHGNAPHLDRGLEPPPDLLCLRRHP